MSLVSKLALRMTATQSGSNSFGGTFQPALEKTISLTDGTTADKADQLYLAERTIGDGANDDIDLAGVLTDAFGSTITMAELVALVVINGPLSGSANTTDLTIGGGSNPFLGFLGGTTPTIGPIKPGGLFCIAAGDAAGIGTVTASTADILRISNSAGAAATIQVGIIARSA